MGYAGDIVAAKMQVAAVATAIAQGGGIPDVSALVVAAGLVPPAPTGPVMTPEQFVAWNGAYQLAQAAAQGAPPLILQSILPVESVVVPSKGGGLPPPPVAQQGYGSNMGYNPYGQGYAYSSYGTPYRPGMPSAGMNMYWGGALSGGYSYQLPGQGYYGGASYYGGAGGTSINYSSPGTTISFGSYMPYGSLYGYSSYGGYSTSGAGYSYGYGGGDSYGYYYGYGGGNGSGYYGY